MVNTTLISPIDLIAILKGVSLVIVKCLNLPSNPELNIWPYYDFLIIELIIYQNTLVISLIILVINNIFLLQLFLLQMHHIVPVHRILNKHSNISVTTTD